MAKQSAGLLIYRRQNNELEVFLVHPGGPFWKNKDEGAWSIPKGEFADDENPLEVANREFHEETGLTLNAASAFIPLQPVKQRGGKTVYAWAVEADFDAAHVHSNTFSMEWPPRSGKMAEFPEVDRSEWFAIPLAREKMIEAQRAFLDRLPAS